MALSHITTQMSETLEYVVTKRQQTFNYLKRAHQGQVYWLNTVKLSRSDITRFYDPATLQKRRQRWVLLGLSLGKLLDIASGVQVVRALSQLLEELDYFVGNPKARCMVSPTRAKETADSDPVRPQVLKLRKLVVYQFLQLLPSDFSADCWDYTEVVESLCDMLSLVYSKFLDPSCSAPHLHDAVLKADKRIKNSVISVMAQDLTSCAQPLLKAQIRGLLSHTFIDESRSSAVQQKFVNLTEGQDNIDDTDTIQSLKIADPVSRSHGEGNTSTTPPPLPFPPQNPNLSFPTD
eukprot:gb/GEZN01013236.1/.p1 GENE.gb/GEZN01013236.1/~~gb/GEZN01013236.1/.p1  ORF type:complete len:308 (-),score=56.90 gb/GEZN01013236.1/:103-978(-)